MQFRTPRTTQGISSSYQHRRAAQSLSALSAHGALALALEHALEIALVGPRQGQPHRH
jgi:hypothetical protein